MADFTAPTLLERIKSDGLARRRRTLRFASSGAAALLLIGAIAIPALAGNGGGSDVSTTDIANPGTSVPAQAQLVLEGPAIPGAIVQVDGSGIDVDTISVRFRTSDGTGQLDVGEQQVTRGAFEADVTVPSQLVHEGPCPSEEACDFIDVEAGDALLVEAVDRRTGETVAQTEFTVAAAELGVGYPVATGCGGIVFDGRTWLYSTDSDAPSEAASVGTMTLTTQSTARFAGENGARFELRSSTTTLDCTTG